MVNAIIFRKQQQQLRDGLLGAGLVSLFRFKKGAHIARVRINRVIRLPILLVVS